MKYIPNKKENDFKIKTMKQFKWIKHNHLVTVGWLKMANQIVFYTRMDYHKRRKGYKRIHKGEDCACCMKPAQITHHIVMVKNGGGSDRNNLVALCKECHAKIHEWLLS